MHLSKSNYMQYLDCPLYLWYWKNDKETVEEELTLSDEFIINQGIDFEEMVRTLYPDGVLAEGWPQEAKKHTQNFREQGKKTIFQATAITDKYLAMADILKYDEENKCWDLIEVKGSTEVKEDHIHDTAFQKLAFEDDGYPIGKVFLIHVNREYRRVPEVKIEDLSVAEDITDQVNLILEETRQKREDAYQIIHQENPPSFEPYIDTLNFKDEIIRDICYPDLPEYSVCDIGRLSNKKIIQLLKDKIYSAQHVPDNFVLSESQRNQIYTLKTGETIIKKEAIQDIFDGLRFPLYFLDYETVGRLVPPIIGAKPYQQIPFQYSLHVLRTPDGKLEHYEFLAKDFENLLEKLLRAMKSHINTPDGTVIVWNKSFEMTRNKEMAERVPEYAEFLKSVNDRVFDLMDIFRNQLYVHANFRGSYSIKKVLPVLVPELSYDDLEIGEGGTASVSWYHMATGKDKQPQKTYQNLLKYCELDTLAMVKIWEVLKKVLTK